MDLCARVSVILLEESGKEKELETHNTCFKQGYFRTEKKETLCYMVKYFQSLKINSFSLLVWNLLVFTHEYGNTNSW